MPLIELRDIHIGDDNTSVVIDTDEIDHVEQLDVIVLAPNDEYHPVKIHFSDGHTLEVRYTSNEPFDRLRQLTAKGRDDGIDGNTDATGRL